MTRNVLLAVVLIVALVASGCISGSRTASTNGSEQQLLNRIDALEQQNADLRQQLEQDNLTIRSYQNQLTFYRAQFGSNVTVVPTVPGTGAAMSGSASLDAPAVMQRSVYERDGPFMTERTERVGALINVTSEVVPGRGRVLVNTTPLMGEVFQDAAITAAYVAQQETGRNLSKSDVIVSIVAEDQVPAVDGGSAGALMTLLTIDQDGRVGAIGGVVEKATAAKEAGKTLFLLPRENSQIVRYTERTRDYYGYSVVQRVPERVDAEEYIESEVGIPIEYVDTIDDVLRLTG